MRKYCLPFLSIFFLAVIIQAGCKNKKTRTVHRSFYYWKSVFKLQPGETAMLQTLHIENLYIKFFDVEWNSTAQKPLPAAPIIFSHIPPSFLEITPVVFITNETLQKTAIEETDSLAGNIIRLLAGIVQKEKMNFSGELQIDCDWTASTKEKYFRLLQTIKANEFCRNKIISATIRLHQLKFTKENGIPPVDKGLLMCYNMGNLRLPEIENSILDPVVLKKYIGQLPLYPLQLDIALPIFDWWVWFRGQHYKGLIHAEDLKGDAIEKEKRMFQTDTVINGFTFEKGDWLRYENSPAKSIQETGALLKPKILYDDIHIILYHLDENNLSKYKTDELESFFNSLR